jgi:integrase
MKLTAREIAHYAPPEGKDHIVFDEDLAGFGLRFRNGRKIWIFQYAHGSGESRVNGRITIGEYPALPPAKAREIAQDYYADVRRGGHPAVEKKQKREEAQHTFGRLVVGYLEFQKEQLRPRSYTLVEYYLNQLARTLHGLPATAIDRRRIADLLDTIAKNNGAVSANRARSALSAMFSWSMRRGLYEGNRNPCADTEKLTKERGRDRVLSDSELVTLWNALGSTDYDDVLRLLILTGQRAGEIGGLRWNEIDFEHDLISLPAQRTKNHQAHSFPMSEPVRKILKARTQKRDFVFGRGAGGYNSWNRSKVRLDAKIKLPDWRVHDLRRTVATGFQRLGTRLEVNEAVLNHVGGSRSGIAGIYQRHTWEDEKKTALDRWAAHVLAVVSGKKDETNVTPLPRRA